MMTEYDYLEWLAAQLPDRSLERNVIIAQPRWGAPQPVWLASGEGATRLDPMTVVRALQEAKAVTGVFGHGHVTTSPPRPSSGDMLGLANLQDRLQVWRMRLTDFVVVNSEGRVWSALLSGVLADPVRLGIPWVKEGLEWSLRRSMQGR